MKDTFIPALILAAISALAWIAYKHPKGYKNIAHCILWLVILPFLLICARLIRLVQFIQHLKNYRVVDGAVNIPVKYILEANKIMVGLGWLLVITIAGVGYLMLLYFLPQLLALREGGEQDLGLH